MREGGKESECLSWPQMRREVRAWGGGGRGWRKSPIRVRRVKEGGNSLN